MLYLKFKSAALDRILSDLPEGAVVIQASASKLLDGNGEKRTVMAIAWIDPRKRGGDPGRKGRIVYPIEEVPQHLEGWVDGMTLTGIGGDYEYPIMPGFVAEAVPEGHKLVNIENTEAGATLHCESATGVLSRIKIPDKVSDPKLLRAFKGVYGCVVPPA